ncbi:hypothetical protein [Burkholderia stabilis]|uniref:hypothetical protein n=1 Tax=Burkholderia stabilis TaxID=95485 RepID=UPI000B17B8C1|nr:hypothetical protein [Burkholderia stabilis]HDR9490128.1 hypothetical protein [Burkholderia stabilis]HDR9521682.1 hypothetical protein [Burkholderia stabilis]HDR9537233.1 hypothetical protein [Burkholderia stabilis]HDR9575179.1 hypothetical protein [Burkholderia stabilis]HDR9624354.1 hypothetical protein [Burkholderia stabilis]
MKTRDLAAAAVIAGVAALPVSSWADTATSPFDTASHPVPDRPAANASGSPAHRATANVEDDYLTDFTDTIGGIDSDGDGVRDDVRKYIDDQYPDPIQRAAMLRYAAAQRDFMMRGELRASAVDGLTRIPFARVPQAVDGAVGQRPVENRLRHDAEHERTLDRQRTCDGERVRARLYAVPRRSLRAMTGVASPTTARHVGVLTCR